MKQTFLITGACALASVSCVATQAFAATIDDGQTTVIDSTVDDFIGVFDGPGGAPTTVIFEPGANITGTDRFDDTVFVEDSSRVIVNGGQFANDVSAYGAASLTINGGTFNDDIFATDISTVTISGGTIAEDVEAWGNAVITIRGGTIREDIEARDVARIDIFGGQFGSSGSFVSSDGFGVVRFFGTDFEIDGEAVDFGRVFDFSGNLSGTLSDGTVFSTSFDRGLSGGFPFAFRGDIFLVQQAIPEPIATLSGALGLSLLTLRRRPQRASWTEDRP